MRLLQFVWWTFIQSSQTRGMQAGASGVAVSALRVFWQSLGFMFSYKCSSGVESFRTSPLVMQTWVGDNCTPWDRVGEWDPCQVWPDSSQGGHWGKLELIFFLVKSSLGTPLLSGIIRNKALVGSNWNVKYLQWGGSTVTVTCQSCRAELFQAVWFRHHWHLLHHWNIYDCSLSISLLPVISSYSWVLTSVLPSPERAVLGHGQSEEGWILHVP